MHTTTKEALRESIEKYQAIVDRLKLGDRMVDGIRVYWKEDGTILNLGTADCALCKLFVVNKCVGCPLKDIGERCPDDESVYQVFFRTIDGTTEEQLEAAQAMLDVLVALDKLK